MRRKWRGWSPTLLQLLDIPADRFSPIEQPGRDTKGTSVEEVTIAVRASDDYGVEMLELRYRVNGGEEARVVLADSGRPLPRVGGLTIAEVKGEDGLR
mgnify:CR=1 FL=1